MKRLTVIAFLLFTIQGFSQNTHAVTVAVNQGEGCPVIDAIETSELFQVFPNPASSSITIQAEIQSANLRLVDIQGKEVRSNKFLKGRLTMDIEGLPKGIYVLFLDHENGSDKIKIKIQ